MTIFKETAFIRAVSVIVGTILAMVLPTSLVFAQILPDSSGGLLAKPPLTADPCTDIDAFLRNMPTPPALPDGGTVKLPPIDTSAMAAQLKALCAQSQKTGTTGANTSNASSQADDYGTGNSSTAGGYCPKLSQTMQRGARDSATSPAGQVTELQTFLVDYYNLNGEDAISGYFGSITNGYVVQFQKEQGLPSFGIVGTLTRAKIAQVCGSGGTTSTTNTGTTNTANTSTSATGGSEVLAASPTSGTAPLSVSFVGTGLQTGSTITYKIDFGDSGSGALNSAGAVTHSYSQAGAYTAKLSRVNNVCGGVSTYGCESSIQVGSATITVSAATNQSSNSSGTANASASSCVNLDATGNFGWDCHVPSPGDSGIEYAGWTCTQIYEGADPDSWNDNYFCSKTNWGIKWSQAGPIKGMNCYAVNPPSEPGSHAWGDDNLCVPSNIGLAFTFSSNGPVGNTGTCVHMIENSDQNWGPNNYLCWSYTGSQSTTDSQSTTGSPQKTADASQPKYPALTGHCDVYPMTIHAGGSTTWLAYASGGNGDYKYAWSTSNAFGGFDPYTAWSSSSNWQHQYMPTGTFYGVVVITSGDGQNTGNITCANPVTVTADTGASATDNSANLANALTAVELALKQLLAALGQ